MNEVIGSLIATRVLIQYLPQTMGFFLLRFRSPDLPRPFQDVVLPRSRNHFAVRMGLRAGEPRQRGLCSLPSRVFAVGTAAYMARAKGAEANGRSEKR